MPIPLNLSWPDTWTRVKDRINTIVALRDNHDARLKAMDALATDIADLACCYVTQHKLVAKALDATDAYRALIELVAIKHLKDTKGKTVDYSVRAPIAWEAARLALATAQEVAGFLPVYTDWHAVARADLPADYVSVLAYDGTVFYCAYVSKGQWFEDHGTNDTAIPGSTHWRFFATAPEAEEAEAS